MDPRQGGNLPTLSILMAVSAALLLGCASGAAPDRRPATGPGIPPATQAQPGEGIPEATDSVIGMPRLDSTGMPWLDSTEMPGLDGQPFGPDPTAVMSVDGWVEQE